MSPIHVFDVTVTNFQSEVVQRSTEVPVLLDFWADWCGPCKTLTPILEKIATEYGGAFVLGRVDTQKEPEIAAAFRVQSIPFVCLMVGGRPADGFSGAVAEREVRAFLKRARIEPAAAAPDAKLEGAKAMLAMARQAVAQGQIVEARAALAGIAEEDELAGERDRMREGLAWFEAALDPATPAAAALLAARDSVARGQLDTAMEHILASVGHDRNYQDGLARKAMVLCFSLLGPDSDLAGEYRRRLATLLY